MFDSIVLSGGLSKGYITLGILKYYSEYITNVKEYAGTSVGSVLCLLLCCGYSPQEIIEGTILDDVPISLSYGVDVGVCSLDNLRGVLLEFIYNKTGLTNPTFRELWGVTGKVLRISVVNATKKKVVSFSCQDQYNRSVVETVIDSCSIPGAFGKRQFNKDFMIDGGILNNFPYDTLPQECVSTLGIMVGGGGPEITHNTPPFGDSLLENASYFWRLLTVPIHYINNNRYKAARLVCSTEEKRCSSVILRTNRSSSSHIQSIAPTKSEKISMIVYGMEFADMHNRSKSFDLKSFSTKHESSVWDEDDYILNY